MTISISSVAKKFGDFVALDNVSLEVPEGELVALLGPSGSGKTTLLRILAGLELPDSGQVLYQGGDVTNKRARDRNFGLVFQHYALFRHMTVFENVAFALRVRKWLNPKVKERVNELLHLVRLEGLGPRYPSQLSGGQQQRVALARALAAQPQVLLLDEPFGALDAKVRQELRHWLRRLHEEIHITSIFVTHDQEEAFEVADKVVVMNRGKIEQQGTTREVFDHPASPFVMDFLGNVNVFQGRVQNGKAVLRGNDLDGLEFAYPDYPHQDARDAQVYIRPHELEIERCPNGVKSATARIVRIHPAGPVTKIQLQTVPQGIVLSAELSRERYEELLLKDGETVYVFPRRVRVFLPEYVI